MTARDRKPRGTAGDQPLSAAWASGAERVLAAPISRAATWLLFAMLGVVVFALGWASLAATDRVATAEGQTIPDRRVQRIQTPEQGTVDRLLVRDGDVVQPGAELVHIDRTELEADFARARTELRETRARILRLRALDEYLVRANRNGLNGASGEFEPVLAQAPEVWTRMPGEASLDRQRRLLRAQWHNYLDETATAREELEQRRSEHAQARVEYAGLRDLLPYLHSQRERVQRMANQELAPVSEFEATEREVIESRIEIDSLERSLARGEAAIAAAESALREVHTRRTTEVARELVDAEEDEALLRHEIRRIRAQLDRRTVTTPVAGTVMDLDVHGAGEVVEPGSAMMKIVPRDTPLEVQAYVSNRDIGRVRSGMEVAVKFEAFDFTRYGAMPGEIVHVSRDATEHDEFGHAYPVLVRMADDTMSVDGEEIAVIPGMDVTVDIHLGERRVIEYFLSPMLRYQDEALREP